MDSNDRFDLDQITSVDGVEICVRSWGDRGTVPVLLLHGGGQTSWAWQATARRLSAAGHRCLAADFRGHGESGWAGDGGYSIDHFVADVHAIVDQLCDQEPVAVGASLGGASALLAEGESDQPLLSALTLVDITPRWETVGVERILAFLGCYPDGFESLEQAADAIREYLPHRNRSANPEGLRKNLRRHDDGRWRWHWDPRIMQSADNVGEQWIPRMIQAARGVDVPTLLVSGGRSDVVSESTINEFLDLVPHAVHVSIDDAHHMVAGDSNDQFSEAILNFLHASADALPTGP